MYLTLKKAGVDWMIANERLNQISKNKKKVSCDLLLYLMYCIHVVDIREERKNKKGLSNQGCQGR